MPILRKAPQEPVREDVLNPDLKPFTKDWKTFTTDGMDIEVKPPENDLLYRPDIKAEPNNGGGQWSEKGKGRGGFKFR